MELYGTEEEHVSGFDSYIVEVLIFQVDILRGETQIEP